MNAVKPVLKLSDLREQVEAYCERLCDKDGPTGCYRMAPGQRPDLYSSLDIVLMRVIMGENLRESLSDRERGEWVGHINSFAKRSYDGPGDGSYEDTFGHSPLHANGMVVRALGPLGGRQPWRVRLYESFDTPEKVSTWLDTAIDWTRQWRSSHLFIGGVHCFSFSSACSPQWLDTVFHWLDDEIDRDTGWWRRGVEGADRHQALGGGVHILPIYQHHGRAFPVPERIIDSTLALQLPSGRWLDRTGEHVMHYFELDALYALRAMRDLLPNYRKDDIEGALDRYIELVNWYWLERREALFALHPHHVLAAVATAGLLQQHRPEAFPDACSWTDIFSDRRFYATSEVEAL